MENIPFVSNVVAHEEIVNTNRNSPSSSGTRSTILFPGDLGNKTLPAESSFGPQLYDDVQITSESSHIINNLDNFPSNTILSHANSPDVSINQCVSDQSQVLLLASKPVLNTSVFDSLSDRVPTVINSSGIPEDISVPSASKLIQSQKKKNICRICANETVKSLPLFKDEGITLSIVEKIHRCLPIKVSDVDALPQYICNECASKLQMCDEFISLSVEGDAKLRIMDPTWTHGPEESCVKVEKFDEESLDLRENLNMLSPRIEEFQNKELEVLVNNVIEPPTFRDQYEKSETRQWNCIECDYKASRQSSLALHMRSKHREAEEEEEKGRDDEGNESRDYAAQGNSNTSFMCEYCDKCFESEARLRRHIAMHTKLQQRKQASHICTFCNTKFPTTKKLQGHLKTVHKIKDEPRFSCDKCDRSYHLASSLDIHQATHSTETPFLCDICGKSFKHGSNLRGHKKCHAEGKISHRHACDICPKKFPSSFLLSEHKNVHLNFTPYSCGVCGKKFHRRIQLRQHRIIHNTESVYECPQCNACFNRRGNMTQHMKRHMTEKKFSCKVCKESFQTLSEVVQHRREKHTELSNPSFRCKVIYCNKSFSSSMELENHTKAHLEDKFECEICHKQLSNRRTLDYHIRCFHSQDRPFSCSFCSESFVSRETCLVHERIHTGERPYPCSECQMSFRTSSNLAQHLRNHRDERPWLCEHCPKSFKRKETLLVHVRTHTGEKPFCCEICGRQFTQKNDMLKHQQTHSSSRPSFSCINCNWSFNSRKELNKHRRAVHSNSRSQLDANIVQATQPQTLLVREDLGQFPIAILEEGSNLVIHQIEEMGNNTQFLEVNPNNSDSQIVHVDDSFLQTIVPQYQIRTVQAPSGQQIIQFDAGSAGTVAASAAMSSDPAQAQNW